MTRKEYHHPPLIRLTHWLNFIALIIMVASGLRIFNASPLWGFRIPDSLTLGGWLAGARQWHFFGMWIFAANGIAWIIYNILSRHGRETTIFRLRDLGGVVPMVLYYLRVRRDHPAAKKYNSLQKLAYTTVPLLAAAGILSGIALYWPVQFSSIARLFGGYDNARTWHFLSMACLVTFFAGHLLMVALAGWRNFLSMITGWGEAK
ncbi:MAG TPA: cytochrome b/b6 domain-containing protein [Bacteroidota bacterium]|nr:cytochrome b/b6 domain-containing protein [Bacteroidota bacterium]